MVYACPFLSSSEPSDGAFLSFISSPPLFLFLLTGQENKVLLTATLMTVSKKPPMPHPFEAHSAIRLLTRSWGSKAIAKLSSCLPLPVFCREL